MDLLKKLEVAIQSSGFTLGIEHLASKAPGASLVDVPPMVFTERSR